MSRNLILAAALLCAGIMPGAARDVSMTVDQLLARIISSNPDVVAARSHHRAVEQGIAIARSAMLPDVSVSLDLTYIGDGTILDRDFSGAMRDRLPHFGNTLSVSLYQPVYHGGSITAGVDMARQSAELAAIGVAQQTDASSIAAIAAYFNLMKMYNLRSVLSENIKVTRRLIDHMTARHEQGTALRNDITRYELRMSTLTLELQRIDNAISVLGHDLVSLLGMDDDDSILPDEPIDRPIPMMSKTEWMSLTSSRSLDLSAVDKTRTMTLTSLRIDRAERLPHVGIVIADNFAGPVTFEIPALNKNYNAWFAGISVKYSLSSLWTVNKKEHRHHLEIGHIDDNRRALEAALSRRVHQAYTDMTLAARQLDTELTNVRLANENYDIVETRLVLVLATRFRSVPSRLVPRIVSVGRLIRDPGASKGY